MGDLVLLVSEVTPVMTKLEEGGIEVTALHNHLLRNEPFTMYMHVLGHGDPVKLAAALHAALAETKTPLSVSQAAPAAAPPPIDLDTAAIDQTLGVKGTNNGGVYQFSIPRAEPCPAANGFGQCDQFSADRRRQGGDHRRFRPDREGGEPGPEGAA